MRCPYCKQDKDRVIDTRPSDDGHITRRRRECLECGRRYTTHERLEELPLRVIKKNGQRVPFDRSNIVSGLMKSLEKRPVSMQQIQEIADSIESEVLESIDREIMSEDIGRMVMNRLRDVDEVAYVRFASVYREFKAVGDFVEEVKTISGKGGKRVSERRRASESVRKKSTE
ncbi:MAG: transcriptional repressor NrdR [Planctomycetes bacterium]|nr:transcriptional repressor NrdR [Planctomycetota bacterium]